MKKSMLAILLCMAMVFALAACGDSKSDTSQDGSDTSESSQSTADSLVLTKDSVGTVLYDKNGVTLTIEDFMTAQNTYPDGSNCTDYYIVVKAENNSDKAEDFNADLYSPTINGESFDTTLCTCVAKGATEQGQIGVEISEDVAAKLGDWDEIKGDIIFYFGDSFVLDDGEKTPVIIKRSCFE